MFQPFGSVFHGLCDAADHLHPIHGFTSLVVQPLKVRPSRAGHGAVAVPLVAVTDEPDAERERDRRELSESRFRHDPVHTDAGENEADADGSGSVRKSVDVGRDVE